VALFDMSFMTKFMVAGKDAGYILDRCSTAYVDGPAGETVYTQWLDERGFFFVFVLRLCFSLNLRVRDVVIMSRICAKF
jgi:hypothetical protein